MAPKVAFVLLFAFVAVQLTTTDSIRGRRDAPETTTDKNAAQTIDEAIQNFKSGLDNLVNKIQENELFQNISKQLQHISDQVQVEGKKLIDKVKDNTQTTQ